MIGLMVLFVIGVYLAVSVLVVLWAIRFAKRKGHSSWLGGIIAVLVMYNLVFWDYIPTKIMFHQYCSKEAGVWIYKTVDQWKKENPGVEKTLEPYKDKNRPDVTYAKGEVIKQYLNPRFIWVVRENGPFPINIFRITYEIVDTKTGEVMARWIDFKSGYGTNPFELGTDYGIKGFKFWLAEDNGPFYDKNFRLFFNYLDTIKNIGRN